MSKDKQVKKWIYSDTATRFANSNKIVLVCLDIMEAVLLTLFMMQILIAKNADFGVIGIPILLYFVGLIANNVIYLKDRSSKKFRYIAVTIYLIAWGWTSIFSLNSYVVMYILPVFFGLILYSDAKLSSIVSIGATLAMFIRGAKGFMILGFDGMGSEVPIILMMILTSGFFCIIAKYHRLYEDDMNGAMNEDKENQVVMTNDILRVVDIVQKEVQNTVTLMEQVNQANDVVNQSLQEISAGALSTAESIQEQTVMTENIRSAIEITDGSAETMAEVAGNSAKQAEESTNRMDEMQKQSEVIEASSAELAEAMKQLKGKVQEVTGITQAISAISNQTNLLALNASIESARAGEAGRGFAVVADQIRQLAEQTKTSTEQIAKITEQLTYEADIAVSLVGKSVQTTEEQKGLILQNASAFQDVKAQSSVASLKASELSVEVNNLVKANDKIVESIAQLSAVSEEVTANAQQATELSDTNVSQIKEAVQKVIGIKDTIMELEKYQDK